MKWETDELITNFLTTLTWENIIHRLGSIVSIFKFNVEHFSSLNQESIALWLEPAINNYPQEIAQFVHILEKLADQSSTAKKLLQKLIPRLDPVKQKKQRERLIRFLPIEEHQPLAELERKTQLFLIQKVYLNQVNTSSLALAKLNEIVLTKHQDLVKYKDIVIAASRIVELAPEKLTVSDLLSWLKSPYTGVRSKALEGLIKLFDTSKTLSQEELNDICNSLKNEEDQNTARLFYELVTEWIDYYKFVPLGVTETLCDILPRLEKKKYLDGGTTKSVIRAFRAIAQTEELKLIFDIKIWTRKILKSVDLKLASRDTIPLYCAINRLDREFLAQIVEQDGQEIINQKLVENFKHIIQALENIKNTELLRKIYQKSWCPLEIKSLIQEKLRG